MNWHYVAEGGHHVLFAPAGGALEAAAPPSLSHSTTKTSATRTESSTTGGASHPVWLLRLKKVDIIKAMMRLQDCQNRKGQPVTRESNDSSTHVPSCPSSISNYLGCRCGHISTTSSNAYQLMIHSRLSPYIDSPTLVTVEDHLVQLFWKEATQSGKVPFHRRSDWIVTTAAVTLSNNNNNNNATGEVPSSSPKSSAIVRGETTLEMTTVAELWMDYRFQLSSPSLTWELKPKAGYCAISPLVERHRRKKYCCSRYQMAHPNSLYHPEQLFSRNLSSIRQAMAGLVETPHNNCKVWTGHAAVWDYERALRVGNHEIPVVKFEGILDSLGESPSLLRSNQLDVALIEMVSMILVEEPCLEKVLALQQLDIIDGDGAIRIYQRLLICCHGSHEHAEGLIDKIMPMTSSSNDLPLLHGSPFEYPVEDSVLREFCALTAGFRDQLQISTTMSAEFMDGIHDESRRLIDRMSTSECVFLLQNWLLSLAMCDVSLFVSVQLPPPLHGIQRLPTTL